MVKNKKVTFILHPLNVFEFKEKSFFYNPFQLLVVVIIALLPSKLIKKGFSLIPPHVFLVAKNITSRIGGSIDVSGVMCCVFPDQMITSKERALKKVIASVSYAVRKGADVVVLTGFTSIITNAGKDICHLFKDQSVLITSGNTFTAKLCVEGIKKAAKIFNKELNELTLAVIGATGDIGRACSIELSKDFNRLILCSRNINEDDDFVSKIKKNNKNLIVTQNISESLVNADIVLIVTSSYLPLVEKDDLKNGAIVCDASLPYNTRDNIIVERKDVFIFDGGKAKLDFSQIKINKKWERFCNNSIYGCIAEGILSGFEGMNNEQTHYNSKISQSNMLKFSELAKLHGIELAEFSFHGKMYTSEHIQNIRNCH